MFHVKKNTSRDNLSSSDYSDNNGPRQWIQSHNPVQFMSSNWSNRTTSLDEVIDETGQLLTGFVNDQIFSEHVQDSQYLLHRPHDPQRLIASSNLSSRNTGAGDNAEQIVYEDYPVEVTQERTLGYFRYPAYASLGQQIKQIADDFARSTGRAELREKAKQQNVKEIDKEKFMDLLRQLFIDGITVERIIALFYFCSDLVLEAMKGFVKERCQIFLQWAFDFIISDSICQWIYENGGWAQILGNIGNTALKIAIGVACVAITFAAFIYIKNNLSSK